MRNHNWSCAIYISLLFLYLHIIFYTMPLLSTRWLSILLLFKQMPHFNECTILPGLFHATVCILLPLHTREKTILQSTYTWKSVLSLSMSNPYTLIYNRFYFLLIQIVFKPNSKKMCIPYLHLFVQNISIKNNMLLCNEPSYHPHTCT